MSSQYEAILAYLKDGNTLTPIEALYKFKTLRLAAVCFDLRRDGHNVVTKMVTRDNKTFAEYRLIPKEPVQRELISLPETQEITHI